MICTPLELHYYIFRFCSYVVGHTVGRGIVHRVEPTKFPYIRLGCGVPTLFIDVHLCEEPPTNSVPLMHIRTVERASLALRCVALRISVADFHTLQFGAGFFRTIGAAGCSAERFKNERCGAVG